MTAGRPLRTIVDELQRLMAVRKLYSLFIFCEIFVIIQADGDETE